jgi:hypothetical protein
MPFSRLSVGLTRRTRKSIRHMLRWPASALVLALVMTAATSLAQQAASAPQPDQQTIQMLVQRINQLEARVAQLEASQQGTAAAPTAAPGLTARTTPPPTPVSTPAATTAQASAPASSDQQPEQEPEVQPERTERMDVSKTLLRIRGFGDMNLHGSNQKADNTSFSVGQLNLFVTSDISENFKFLSEIVFEAGTAQQSLPEHNVFSVDIERYLLLYSKNDYFNLAIGRYHTAIGYYNTAYHHSTWLQTATGRPFLFDFEDQGGILPIHNVGISASGLIPSGRLGLHYVAEIGNGRAWRTAEPVQNTIDENTHKAFNLALFARPEAVHGLQIGFSGYHDLLTPGGPNISETILAGHFVIVRPKFEWLNEALVVRHAPEGSSRLFNTPGFYTQISKQYGAYRPYFRYQYVNAPPDEPLFSTVGLRQGPSVGLRYDASESVAIKLQYDYTALRQQPATSGVGLQVGFTF